MSSIKEILNNFSTFHPDTLHPRVDTITPSSYRIDNGMLHIPNEGNIFAATEKRTVSNLGKIHTYQHTKNENLFIALAEGGYEVTVDKDSGDFSYTIYPQFDIDFSLIEQMNDAEKDKFWLQMTGAYAKATATNSEQTDTNLSLRIGIGTNDSQFFRVTDKETCGPNLSNVRTAYREENGSYHVVGLYSDIVSLKQPQGKRTFNIITSAKVPHPSHSLRKLFEDYTSKAMEGDLPRRKDIASLVQTTIHMREIDPFDAIK